MKARILNPSLLLVCVLLCGCSSAGSSSPLQAKGALVPPGVASAARYHGPQGVFDEPNSTFDSIITVLDTGELYGMDVINGQVAGFFHGTAVGTNAITSNAIEYNALDGGYIQDVNFSAAYAPPSLTVKLVFPFGTFDGNAKGQKPYVKGDSRAIYLDPAPMTRLAGTYDGELGTVGTAMERYSKVQGLALRPDGSFAATAGNCQFSGHLLQHGKTGVYDIVAQAGGSGCMLSGALKGLMTPVELGTGSTTLGFQMLSLDATKSASLYVKKNL